MEVISEQTPSLQISNGILVLFLLVVRHCGFLAKGTSIYGRVGDGNRRVKLKVLSIREELRSRCGCFCFMVNGGLPEFRSRLDMPNAEVISFAKERNGFW